MMVFIIGEVIKLHDGNYYVVVNPQGTLEKLPYPKWYKRLLLEIRQGLGIYFKTPTEARQYINGAK